MHIQGYMPLFLSEQHIGMRSYNIIIHPNVGVAYAVAICDKILFLLFQASEPLYDLSFGVCF